MIIKSQGTQKESEVIHILGEKKAPILHYSLDYDSMHPEETIRLFVKNVKAMVKKYELNKDRVIEIEKEIVDIEHYMEISTNKTVPLGYKLYRKLADLRRERRACKNENDLLQPIYEYFHATEVLNRLSKVQGDCAKAKSTIDERVFQARTNVLDAYLEPEKKPKKTEEEPASEDISEEPSEATASNVATLFDSITQVRIPDTINQEAAT